MRELQTNTISQVETNNSEQQQGPDANEGDGGECDGDVPGLPFHEAPPPQDPTRLHRGHT